MDRRIQEKEKGHVAQIYNYRNQNSSGEKAVRSNVLAQHSSNNINNDYPHKDANSR